MSSGIIAPLIGMAFDKIVGGSQDDAPEAPVPKLPPPPPPAPAPERGTRPEDVAQQEAAKNRARRRRITETRGSINKLNRSDDSKSTLFGE